MEAQLFRAKMTEIDPPPDRANELSYALLARARESFELCSHFKSLQPVLTWRARRRKPEFPGPGTQSRCVLGERGVNAAVFCKI